MTPAEISAIATAAVSIITAIGTLVRQFKHESTTKALVDTINTPGG